MPRHLLSLMLSSLIVGLSLTACGASAACSDPQGCVTAYPDEPFVIAAAFPLTGEEREWGNAALEAAQHLADEKELLTGHPVEIAKEDLNCVETSREDAVVRLTGIDNLIAVILTPCSAGDEQFINSLENAGVPLFSVPRGEEAVSQTEITLQAIIDAARLASQSSSNGQATLPRQSFLEALKPAGLSIIGE